MKVINGEVIKNLPWEDKPEGCKDVVWRSAKNPILTRDAIKDSNSLLTVLLCPLMVLLQACSEVMTQHAVRLFMQASVRMVSTGTLMTK